jgi:hypothetical protein
MNFPLYDNGCIFLVIFESIACGKRDHVWSGNCTPGELEDQGVMLYHQVRLVRTIHMKSSIWEPGEEHCGLHRERV